MRISKRKLRKWKSAGKHRSHAEKRDRLIKQMWKDEND